MHSLNSVKIYIKNPSRFSRVMIINVLPLFMVHSVFQIVLLGFVCTCYTALSASHCTCIYRHIKVILYTIYSSWTDEVGFELNKWNDYVYFRVIKNWDKASLVLHTRQLNEDNGRTKTTQSVYEVRHFEAQSTKRNPITLQCASSQPIWDGQDHRSTMVGSGRVMYIYCLDL